MPYIPTLDMSIRFPAEPDVVWAALTDTWCTKRWCPTLELPPHAGGRVRLQTVRPRKKRPRTASGRVTSVTSGSELNIELYSQPRGFRSQLTITVNRSKHSTRVRIVEHGLPGDEYAELVSAELRDGWRNLLGELGDYLADPDHLDELAEHLREH